MWIIARIEREKEDSLINLDQFYKAIRDQDNSRFTRLVIDTTKHMTIEMDIVEFYTRLAQAGVAIGRSTEPTT